MLDIYALQVFYEAARSNSFTAAARKLNLTQPAVSMQIKTLEDYLQIKLFDRTGRNVQLTKAGQALLPRARQLIDISIQTEEFMRSANNEVLGDLVIGSSLPSTNDVLVHLVALFQKEYPLVKFQIYAVSHEELLAKIANGQFDFGIMNIINRSDPVECLPLFEDQIVLIAPVNHTLQPETPVTPDDLRTQTYVCQDENSACRYAVRDALLPYGIDIAQFDIRMEISNQRAIVAAVERGVGLSFVSLLDAYPALERGTIHTIHVEGIHLEAQVGLAFSNNQTSSLAGLKFKEFMTHTHTRQEIERLIDVPHQDEFVGKIYA